jgi:hypothetical protein
MGIFRPFEEDIIRLLAAPVLGQQIVDSVLSVGEFVEYDYSGVGYFVTVRHPDLPQRRVVLDQPSLSGSWNGVEGHYLAFVENCELMLECWSTEPVFPEQFRNQDVHVLAV